MWCKTKYNNNKLQQQNHKAFIPFECTFINCWMNQDNGLHWITWWANAEYIKEMGTIEQQNINGLAVIISSRFSFFFSTNPPHARSITRHITDISTRPISFTLLSCHAEYAQWQAKRSRQGCSCQSKKEKERQGQKESQTTTQERAQD